MLCLLNIIAGMSVQVPTEDLWACSCIPVLVKWHHLSPWHWRQSTEVILDFILCVYIPPVLTPFHLNPLSLFRAVILSLFLLPLPWSQLRLSLFPNRLNKRLLSGLPVLGFWQQSQKSGLEWCHPNFLKHTTALVPTLVKILLKFPRTLPLLISQLILCHLPTHIQSWSHQTNL